MTERIIGEVAPALTEEEWSAIFQRRLLQIAISCLADTCMPTSDSPTRDDAESWHACAALCLYNQPFGFTREHIDAIRSLVMVEESDDTNLAHNGTTRLGREVIARIAALLPPVTP